MTMVRMMIAAGAAFALTGCMAKAALDIATAPVRAGVAVTGKTHDLLTTSQSESDEKRGRAMRQREEQLARLERRYRQQGEDCAAGDRSACEDQRETWDRMQALYRGS